METRRTNGFLRMALSSRSPAHPKYYKGKFYENNQDTRLNFPGMAGMRAAQTAAGGNRGHLEPLQNAGSASPEKNGKKR